MKRAKQIPEIIKINQIISEKILAQQSLRKTNLRKNGKQLHQKGSSKTGEALLFSLR